MLKEELLSNSETKKMQLNLVDLTLSAMKEILELNNNIMKLKISKNNKMIGITRERNNRKRNSKEPFHLRFQMMRSEEGRKKLIANGNSNKIK